jgi:recombination protein RecT
MSTAQSSSASDAKRGDKKPDDAASSKELAKQEEPKSRGDLKKVLTSDGMMEQFAKALPRHLSAERFVRICSTALLRTPLLLECTQESFFKCLLDLSAMGLEPDGTRAHLIPYKNNNAGTVECTLLIDYKGLVEIVRRSPDIARVHADIVCPTDDFEFSAGQIIRHTWDLAKPRGALIGAYAMVVLKDGTNQAVVLQKHEIEEVRGRSKSKDKGPWVTDYAEMSKKTAFRRLCKWLTLSPEVLQHISEDDEAEFGAYYRQQNSNRALLSHDKKVKPIDPFQKGGASDEGN